MLADQSEREDLSVLLNTIANYRFDDLIFSHVGYKIRDNEILVNPLSRLFSEISPKDIVKVNIKGETLDSPASLKPTGFRMLQAVFESRQDVKCAIHTHSKNAIALATLGKPLLPLCQQAKIIGTVNVHPLGDPYFGDREKELMIENLGSCYNLILEHHGLLSLGNSLAEAFLRLYFFEYAADIQLKTCSHLTQGESLKEMDINSSFTDVFTNKNLVEACWEAIKNSCSRS